MVYNILKYKKFVRGVLHKLLYYIMISVFVTVFVFGYGTGTSGSAMRHRIKIMPLLIMVYAIIKMNKLKKRKTIMLKISVIIPVYNVADYLKECLDSVLQQTYENLEVILVNDGSTDISPSICDKYASEDSRILVVHKLNGGLSDARNCGLNISTGEYVFFIDSDDYLTDNNAITEIVEGIENHCDIDLVIFQYKKYYNVTNKMILLSLSIYQILMEKIRLKC